MFNRLAVVLAVLTVEACVHYVYNPVAAAPDTSAIKAEVRRECGNQRCEVERCWNETAELVVCDIGFSFSSPLNREDALRHIHEHLKKRGLEVGFCGEDALGSGLASAMLCNHPSPNFPAQQSEHHIPAP